MTDPLNGVSSTEGPSAGGRYSGGKFSEDHKKKKAVQYQADLVEISKVARSRSAGRKKKSLLEYLKELFS
ncbi:MAG: hypothetical protein PHN84_05490 [Desulfuromonadaceae bacterium]|nr:hypothetical protein [Desulfuromonadaceae bacterium]MDD2855016.1 hypothetical protein [Desulfuromonadaceae bacterium]